MAEVTVYVSNEHDTASAQALIGRVNGGDGLGRTAAVSNLYGSAVEAVPAVVLEVMRLKKRGTLPLTVADDNPVLSGRLPEDEELRGWLAKPVTEAAAIVHRADSAVQFSTDSRVHMSWFVNDLAESTRFYEVFFGQLPSKRRPDYVKFELEDPPLHLALNQDKKPTPGGFIAHMGVQLKSTEQIAEAKKRYLDAGFEVQEENATACCYAVQNKIWIGDPDGNRWELFVTTDNEREFDPADGCACEGVTTGRCEDCSCYDEIAPSRVGGTAGIGA
jgi:catechol 2,3-dioxygenase-like lactoylglutathione lyase family enzyme